VNPLQKVNTRKEFMDELGSLIAPPKVEVTDSGELRGRPTLLKSYLIETNSPLTRDYVFDHTIATIEDTGLDEIKILTMRTQLDSPKAVSAQFYLDVSDRRFWVLHTNYRAEETHPFVERLITSQDHEFDNAWLSTNAMKQVAGDAGNKDYGFQVDYQDFFDRSDDEDDITPQEDFHLETTGTISAKALSLLKKDPLVRRTIGYERITIGRGTRSRGVLEDITCNGRFSVIKGKSVDDHMVLVNAIKSDYIGQVKKIESQRIHGNIENKSVEGTAFDFEFERDVSDWNRYLSVIFNAKAPFRLWGIKSKVNEKVFRVLAVDMHTGHPVDFEITDHLIRMYLPNGSCGNVVLRLFVNLQRYFDSGINCPLLQGSGRYVEAE
jgi:hypothetical protein